MDVPFQLQPRHIACTCLRTSSIQGGANIRAYMLRREVLCQGIPGELSLWCYQSKSFRYIH